VGEPLPRNRELVPPRRRMLAALPAAAPEPAAPAPAPARHSREEILLRLQRVREDCERVRRDLEGGYATAAELYRQSAELRARRGQDARGAA
jgi:hypothetical protein